MSNNKIKIILLSQVSLPYYQTGSWSAFLYKDYLFGPHQIDHFICKLSTNHEGLVAYGKMIQKLHFVTQWEKAMIEFMETPLVFEPLPRDLYSSEAWNLGMNEIISNAKISLQ